MLIFFLVSELKKKYEINQEIRSLQREIVDLESKNQEIKELIQYFKTSEYRERQARSLLNLQKPGEFAVVLPPLPEENLAATSSRENSLEKNWKQWWNYFFGKK